MCTVEVEAYYKCGQQFTLFQNLVNGAGLPDEYTE